MAKVLTSFTSAYGTLMIAALGYSLLSGKNIDLSSLGLVAIPIVSGFYTIVRCVSYPNVIPSLRNRAEQRRMGLALALGFGSAIFISKMGMAAGGAALLALVVCTLSLIGLGGAFRAFHAAAFGTITTVVLLFLLEVQLKIHPSLNELLRAFGYFIIAPTLLAQVVTWCFPTCKSGIDKPPYQMPNKSP